MSERRPSSGPRRTIVIDVDIPITRLVMIFLKFTIAAIPAAIVAWLVVTLLALALIAVFGPNFMGLYGHYGAP